MKWVDGGVIVLAVAVGFAGSVGGLRRRWTFCGAGFEGFGHIGGEETGRCLLEPVWMLGIVLLEIESRGV